MREILQAPSDLAAFPAVLYYIQDIREVSETEPEQLRELVRQLWPKAEEAFMTGAEILRAEGRAEGAVKTEVKILLRLLGQNFGTVPEEIVKRVEGASIDELDRWVERVINAATLNEVFAD